MHDENDLGNKLGEVQQTCETAAMRGGSHQNASFRYVIYNLFIIIKHKKWYTSEINKIQQTTQKVATFSDSDRRRAPNKDGRKIEQKLVKRTEEEGAGEQTRKGKGEVFGGCAPLLGIDAPDADLAVVERCLLRRELPLRAASAAAAVHRRERPDPEPETAIRVSRRGEIV